MDSEENDINKEDNHTAQKITRKRTKKNESDNRDYICPECRKSYLSHAALYTHRKAKHNKKTKTENNRGRPKKKGGNISKDDLDDPWKLSFFEKEERKGKTPIANINECAKRAFKFIYDNNRNNVEKLNMKEYNSIEEYPFLYNFINNKHDVDLIEERYENTDKVLLNYLNQRSDICNEKYFEKLIVFVVLFREYININNKLDSNEEYTVIKTAEDVPEKSNEFINDFLYPEDEENIFGLEKKEVIKLIINLCNWMFENDFSNSKIFLNSNQDD